MKQKRAQHGRGGTKPASLRTSGHSKLKLEISATAGGAAVPFLRRQLRRAHRLARSPVRELSVALVGKQRMSRLHRRYLGISKPTDVLSFPLETNGRGRVVAGEIVVCAAEAKKQAIRRKIPVQRELLLYALHGLLHLSGFDDRTVEGFCRMHRMEDMILSRLGIGATFNAGAGGGGRCS